MLEHRCLAGAFMLLAVAPSLAAQSAPPAPGSRVRVVSRATAGRLDAVVSGYIVWLHGDTLVIRTGLAPPDTIILGPQIWLEMRTATGRSRAREGAAYGGVMGALGGAVIGATTQPPCRPPSGSLFVCSGNHGSGDRVLGGAVLGGVAGTVLGAAIGRAMREEGWVPVGAARFRVGVVLGPAGPGMGLRVAF